jgi:hypothetical protein
MRQITINYLNALYSLLFIGVWLPVYAEEEQAKFKQAVQQRLRTVLAGDVNVSTKKFTEKIASTTGLSSAAVKENLLLLLGDLEKEFSEERRSLNKRIEEQANKIKIRPDRAWDLVVGLIMRTHEIIEKDQDYTMGTVLANEAKKARLSLDKSKELLMQLIPPVPASDDTATTPDVPFSGESGLFIEGYSAYNIERELQRFARQPELAQQSSLFAFFGTLDEVFIREQTTDIHKYVVSLVAEKIRNSPLGQAKWGNDYKLSFTVLALDFWTDPEGRVEWKQGICAAQVGVILQRISDRQILFEQSPPLIIQVKKETPGGRQKLHSLYEEIAQQIWQSLAHYWFEEHKK